MTDMTYRTEADKLGEKKVAASKYYGISVARSLENFPNRCESIGSDEHYVPSLAKVKKACARANHKAGLISTQQLEAIEYACDKICSGELSAHFVVSSLEGSGATSTNMNVNEVIANAGLEYLGYSKGEYSNLHPNDHVNCSQSTSDVIPTAIKISLVHKIMRLAEAVDQLKREFERKADAFAGAIKLGRTCLQDALPMTWGDAFTAYSEPLARSLHHLKRLHDDLAEIPIGGTGIGSGLGATKRYQDEVLHEMSEIVGFVVSAPRSRFDAIQNNDCFLRVSSEFKILALSLQKISNDFMILSSGPKGGAAELKLKELQVGSSMMPGKVNPVACISFSQVAFAVAGNDTAVSMAVSHGHLEINSYEPLIAYSLFQSCDLLDEAIRLFSTTCVEPLDCDLSRSRDILLSSSAIASALSRTLGYEQVSKLVSEANDSKISFIDLLEQKKVLTRQEALEIIEGHEFGEG